MIEGSITNVEHKIQQLLDIQEKKGKINRRKEKVLSNFSQVTLVQWINSHQKLAPLIFHPPPTIKKYWNGIITTEGITCSWHQIKQRPVKIEQDVLDQLSLSGETVALDPRRVDMYPHQINDYDVYCRNMYLSYCHRNIVLLNVVLVVMQNYLIVRVGNVSLSNSVQLVRPCCRGMYHLGYFSISTNEQNKRPSQVQ